MQEMIHAILDWLVGLGYWGVLVGLAIEIIPSEIVLAFAGYLVSQGEITFVGAVLFGTAGCLIAQLILYWIGRYGGRPFLQKYGKYLLIKDKHIDMTEQWFERYGAGVIFTARFIPVIRQAISIPAGIAKMPLFSYTFYTTLASVVWSSIFVYLGVTLGEHWAEIDDKVGGTLKWLLYGAIAAVFLYIIYKIIANTNFYNDVKSKWPGKRKQLNEKTGNKAEQQIDKKVDKKVGKSADKKDKKDVEHADRLGEQEVVRQLERVGEEYIVLHKQRVTSKGNSQMIDHIVLGANGLFHIEPKFWSGEITFTEHGVEREGGKYENPTAQLYRYEYVLKELLREHQLSVELVGILCFAHPDSRVIGKSPAFTTLQPDRLVHFIKTYKPRRLIAQLEIRKLAELLKQNGQA